MCTTKSFTVCGSIGKSEYQWKKKKIERIVYSIFSDFLCDLFEIHLKQVSLRDDDDRAPENQNIRVKMAKISFIFKTIKLFKKK